jgi:hypothetical protein
VAEVLAPAKLPPRVVSYSELRRALLPFCAGYSWAEDAIRDLWLLGAPAPTHHTDRVERRVLLPTQFAKWWADVANRMALEATPSEAYTTLIHLP